MARTIPAALQTVLDQNLGTEPINIIAVQWSDGGNIYWYADKEISFAAGKILSKSELDNTIVIQGVQAGVSSDSQAISVTLSDTDGTIKNIIDNNEIHKQAAWVYQSAQGLDHTTGRALIFKGEISSPMQWNEGDRTVSFDIISQVEGNEVGFSMEEGDFPYVPQELIGQPWPLVFGTVKECQALKTRSPRKGVLKTGFGIRDFVLEPKREQAALVCCPWRFIGYRVQRSVTNPWGGGPLTITPRYQKDVACECKKAAVDCELAAKIAFHSSVESATITVLDGSLFPQGTFIRLDIDGAKVSGQFNGTPESPSNVFTVAKYEHPQFADYEMPEIEDFGCEPPPNGFNQTQTTPAGTGTESCILTVSDNSYQCDNYSSRFTNYLNTTAVEKTQAAWNRLAEFREVGAFYADAGAEVLLDTDSELVYVVNLLPSTIHQVKAWRTFPQSNLRRLVTVPATHYTVRQSDFGSYTVQEIVLNRPLSLIPDEDGWEDELYVTLTSSVGPNTVDIMEWLIDKYTDGLTYDASFASVKTALENYPMDFKVPGRMNLLSLLQQMAFWNRCALTLRNDVFHLTYLAAEPAEDETITEDDVLANSLILDHTDTEDLVTKFVAEWRPRCSLEEPYKYVLRYNVRRYKIQEEIFDCFVFRHQTLVDKSAKFWLLRMGNTWRKIRCKVPVSKLKLESLDGVYVTLPDIADGEIKCRVESAVYNSADRAIDLVIWTPVRSGERTPYDFAYPAAISVTTFHPTVEDLQFGNAGSTGPNIDVTPPESHVLGQPPQLPQGFSFGQDDPCGNISANNLGGPALANRCRPDMGDSVPSDLDDQKPANTDLQDGKSVNPPSSSPKQEIDVTDYLNLQSQLDQQEGQDATNGNQDAKNQNQSDSAQPNESPSAEDLKDQTEDLPDPNDLEGCHWDVNVFFGTTKAVDTGSGVSNTPGDTGCYLTPPSDLTETYAFDSVAARDNFFDNMASVIASAATVGERHPINQNKTNFIASGCPQQEPDYEPTGMVGYASTTGERNNGMGFGDSGGGANDGFGLENWTAPAACP